MKTFAAIFVCIVISCGQLHAQIVTDRPDQTESSLTVPNNALQLESGILANYSGGETLQQLLLPTNLFRFGLNEQVELRITHNVIMQGKGENRIIGVGDLEVGAKIQLFRKAESNTTVALLTHFVLPTGTAEYSIGEGGTVNKLCISHALNNGLGLGYNIGYNYLGQGNGDLTYSLSLAKSVSDKVGVYAEPYGQLTNFEDLVLSFDAGFTFLFSNNIQGDISFGTGVNHTMNYFAVGCSWLFADQSVNSK